MGPDIKKAGFDTHMGQHWTHARIVKATAAGTFVGQIINCHAQVCHFLRSNIHSGSLGHIDGLNSC